MKRFTLFIVGAVLLLSITGCHENTKQENEQNETNSIENSLTESSLTENSLTEYTSNEVDSNEFTSNEIDSDEINSDIVDIAKIREMYAGSIVDINTLEKMSADEINSLFYVQEISEDIYNRINGYSYKENDNISIDELSYIRVLHKGFDDETHIGELIVNNEISDDIVEIMRELYKADYPIEKMLLVDEYGADDDISMEENNTSAFNYRVVEGTSRLSKHSFGKAIDINPFYNPYVRTNADGSIHCSPEKSLEYADRQKDFPYKIDEQDLCYKLFKKHGFTWGGNWKSVKDYQHFQKD